MADADIKDFTLGTAKTIKADLIGGKYYPGHINYDSAGGEVVGTKTDAKSTATDTTSVSAMQVWKQVSASVQSLVTGTVLAAGTALVGKVKTKFINAAATALTRPANTTPYSINDAVSDNGTAGSVTAKSVTLSDVNDDTVTIERVRLATTDTGTQGKAFRMYLYNSDPTANSGVSGGDNAAFSNKQAGFIGCLSGTFRTFSDGAVAVLVPDEGSRLVTAPTSGARTVFWQLQTLDAFTPSANSTTFTPIFEGFQGAA